ncbi:MAG TPA: hypothetical protein VNU71_15145, partial [Burkholderiaceae bacterium]|nr:hypothetical protein [Burkholderiaceae bacterium]
MASIQQVELQPVAAHKAAGPATAWWVTLLRKWGTVFVIALTAVAFAVSSEYFLTFSNLNNVLFSMIVSCMVSMGLTFVVVVGSFDLSVGIIV